MTREQIESINAATGGDDTKLDAAIASFLGLDKEFKAAGNKVPQGNEGAFHNIRDEVVQYNEADDETKAGIEAYKGAKAPQSAGKKTAAKK